MCDLAIDQFNAYIDDLLFRLARRGLDREALGMIRCQAAIKDYPLPEQTETRVWWEGRLQVARERYAKHLADLMEFYSR